MPALPGVVGRAYRRLGPAAPCTSRERRWLLVIVLVATALRLAWVLYAAREPRSLHDPSLYEVYAARIADGHGYTAADGQATTYYPVGYVGALGAVVWIVRLAPFPDNVPLTAGLFNLVLGVGTVALIFEIGRRLFDNRVGLISAGVVALWPNLIFHTAVILTETLFVFLVMAALLLIVALPASSVRIGWRRLAAFGAVLALSAMVRPISLAFLPVLVIVLAIARAGWRTTIGSLGIAAVAVGLVLAPWTLRNLRVTGSFVAISTNLGDNLCMSRHPGANGGFQPDAACIVRTKTATVAEREIEVNDTNTRRAARFVRQHPASEIKLVFLRAYHTVENDHDGLLASESYGSNRYIPSILRRALEIIADAFFFTALALSAFAVPAFIGRCRPWRLFFLLAALALAVQPLIFFGDPRFHVPVLPFMAVFAAVTLVRARDRLAAKRAKEAMAG